MQNKPEILAPVGSMAALKAAVNNGADAVYLGVGNFNARVKADNFTLDTIKEALQYAHLFGVRVFVAFNTLIKEAEMDSAVACVRSVVELGADAIILQDLGLLFALKKQGIKIEFHASTQMGIHNLAGARVAQTLGFKRIVLARETLLSDIVAIKKETDLEIEFFVHGALCVAFSGNCYFSSLITGESGNRGRCLQLCRKPYKLFHQSDKILQEGYVLSPRDINLSMHLKKLVNAGVHSFKIEGRLRRPEYVAQAVKVYKNALIHQPTHADQNNLKIMFNRGEYCTAHLNFSDNSIIDAKHPSHIGLKIGTVQSVVDKNSVAQKHVAQHATANKNKAQSLRTNHFSRSTLHPSPKTLTLKYDTHASQLQKEDGVKFMREGIEVGSARITNPLAITFTGDVKVGDAVHITSQASLNEHILANSKHIALKASAVFKVGSPVTYSITDGIIEITTTTQSKVEESKNAPLTLKKLQLLSKTAHNALTISDITIDLPTNCFISVSELKEMRRQAIEEYLTKRLVAHKTKYLKQLDCWNESRKKAGISDAQDFFELLNCYQIRLMQLPNKPSRMVMVSAPDVITPKLLAHCDYCVLKPLKFSRQMIKDFIEVAKEKAVLSLPNMVRGLDVVAVEEILATLPNSVPLMINNLGALSVCHGRTIVLGAQMNILNNAWFKTANNTLPAKGQTAIAAIASYESGAAQKWAINYVYGYVPLMTLAHCPKKSATHNTSSSAQKRACAECQNIKHGTNHSAQANNNTVAGVGAELTFITQADNTLQLLDERNANFTLRHVKLHHCYWELLNAIPLDNREILCQNHHVLIDLTFDAHPTQKLMEILTTKHSHLVHTHGNYKRGLH